VRPIRRFLTVERLEAVARKALAEGYGRLHLWDDATPRRRVELVILNDCENPYGYELHARDSAWHGRKVKPLSIIGQARCRKCEACMAYRTWEWQTRGKTEYHACPRTYLGTFTMSPENHLLLDYRIEQGVLRDPECVEKGWKQPPRLMRDLSAQEILNLRVRYFGYELQAWLKRIRKGDGKREPPELRYLLVAEQHDSSRTDHEMRGRPHYHVLLHDLNGQTALGSPAEALANGKSGEHERRWYRTKKGWKQGVFLSDTAFVREQFKLGFTKFQFAEDETAVMYVTKYITKTLSVKIRASQKYGKLNGV